MFFLTEKKKQRSRSALLGGAAGGHGPQGASILPPTKPRRSCRVTLLPLFHPLLFLPPLHRRCRPLLSAPCTLQVWIHVSGCILICTPAYSVVSHQDL